MGGKIAFWEPLAIFLSSIISHRYFMVFLVEELVSRSCLTSAIRINEPGPYLSLNALN